MVNSRARHSCTKSGDTLIEVALAVGIFSLVAIGIVSVVSASTSSAQAALEVTITREEIDAQADALRFIHNSYIAGGTANAIGNDKYKAIWEAITKSDDGRPLAIDLNTADNAVKSAVTNYNPTTCEAGTDDGALPSALQDHAFILNTRVLANGDDAINLVNYGYPGASLPDDFTIIANSIVLPANGIYEPPATYPRLIYEGSTDDDGSVYNSSRLGNTSLSKSQGLYIIAVKDPASTYTVSGTSTSSEKKSAYYDFYIRSCWFPSGADHPSTISTAVRLSDPSIIKYGTTTPDGGGGGVTIPPSPIQPSEPGIAQNGSDPTGNENHLDRLEIR